MVLSIHSDEVIRHIFNWLEEVITQLLLVEAKLLRERLSLLLLQHLLLSLALRSRTLLLHRLFSKARRAEAFRQLY